MIFNLKKSRIFFMEKFHLFSCDLSLSPTNSGSVAVSYGLILSKNDWNNLKKVQNLHRCNVIYVEILIKSLSIHSPVWIQ
jgi:hypothetical protein